MKAMRFRREPPYNKPEKIDQSGYSEFEEEFKPPVRKRLLQIVIVILALTTLVLAVVAKVSINQNQQATLKADQAIHAQRTVEAQVNSLATQVNSMTAAVEAPSSISSTQQREQLVPDIPALTRSRELAYTALTQLNEDPERSILIAMEANQAAHTPEAEDALRRALHASHIRLLLSQPGAKIRSAEFSPNGELIVTTNSIGEARVWNANDGELGPLLHEARNILSAQFSPDGRFILTLDDNQTAIRLWDASTGAPVSVLSGQRAYLTAAQFSLLGNRIVTGDTNATVRIWYTNGISDSVVLSSSLGSIEYVEWSPDDRLILATGQGGLAVWDTQLGKQLYNIASNQDQGPTWVAHFTPYRKQLVMNVRGNIRILDAYTGQLIRTIDSADSSSILVSPDGGYMLAGKVLREFETGQVIARFPMENGSLAQFSPTGHYLLTYNDPQALMIWDMWSGMWPPPLASAINMNTYPQATRFSPYSQTLVTVHQDGAARVWAIQPDDTLPSDYQHLLLLGLTRATRSLSCLERQTYLHDTTPCATPTP
jgi:WD40 repeat protein